MPRIEFWNRRVHTYAGLYFLIIIWFFSLSGLLLNHPKWEISQYWTKREESTADRIIRPPVATDDMERAKELIRQLNLDGEFERTKVGPNASAIEISIAKPGLITNVKADLAEGRAKITETRLNAFGVASMLHTFTGVRMNEPALRRDWMVTTIWSILIDALCVGLIFLVLSGLYMNWQRIEKRWIGAALLAAGTILCAFFVVGLAWIF